MARALVKLSTGEILGQVEGCYVPSGSSEQDIAIVLEGFKPIDEVNHIQGLRDFLQQRYFKALASMNITGDTRLTNEINTLLSKLDFEYGTVYTPQSVIESRKPRQESLF